MIGSATRALLLAAHAAHREVAHRAVAAPTQRTAPNSGLRLSNAPPAPPTRDLRGLLCWWLHAWFSQTCRCILLARHAVNATRCPLRWTTPPTVPHAPSPAAALQFTACTHSGSGHVVTRLDNASHRWPGTREALDRSASASVMFKGQSHCQIKATRSVLANTRSSGKRSICSSTVS